MVDFQIQSLGLDPQLTAFVPDPTPVAQDQVEDEMAMYMSLLSDAQSILNVNDNPLSDVSNQSPVERFKTILQELNTLLDDPTIFSTPGNQFMLVQKLQYITDDVFSILTSPDFDPESFNQFMGDVEALGEKALLTLMNKIDSVPLLSDLTQLAAGEAMITKQLEMENLQVELTNMEQAMNMIKGIMVEMGDTPEEIALSLGEPERLLQEALANVDAGIEFCADQIEGKMSGIKTVKEEVSVDATKSSVPPSASTPSSNEGATFSTSSSTTEPASVQSGTEESTTAEEQTEEFETVTDKNVKLEENNDDDNHHKTGKKHGHGHKKGHLKRSSESKRLNKFRQKLEKMADKIRNHEHQPTKNKYKRLRKLYRRGRRVFERIEDQTTTEAQGVQTVLTQIRVTMQGMREQIRSTKEAKSESR